MRSHDMGAGSLGDCFVARRITYPRGIRITRRNLETFMKALKTFATAITLAAASLFTMASAHAELIDFTDWSIWGSGMAGRSATAAYLAPGAVTLNARGGNLNFNARGVGIGDRRISGPERLVIRFDQAVSVTSLNLYHLFKGERVRVNFFASASDRTPSSSVIIRRDCAGLNECSRGPGGYLSATFDGRLAQRLVIFAPKGDAGVGGIGVAATPIPAAAWLFGSALLGVAGIGYRRRQRA